MSISTFFIVGYTQYDEEKIISLYYDDTLLIEAKEAVEAKDPAIMEHYLALKEYADRNYLTMKPLSIVDDKVHLAPSRDPRDYISLSPYWWPDPKVEGGVPYIRDDGKTNPEVYEYHERERGELFGKAVQTLAVVYFLSQDEKYAAKAAELIRTWFLDHKKGMNPNMTYAQYVPGMTKIRGTGIIDSRRFITGLNAAQIIKDSESWSDKDRKDLQRWAMAFAYWLENSVNGLTESKTQNNHALWYDMILQATVMYSGDYDHLREIIVDQELPRFDRQIAKDGSLPHELARTLGLHYTTFSLEAVNFSDIMAQKIGIDVWGYVGKEGRSMKMAVDYVSPYYENPEKWPHKQIKPFETSRGAIILYHAARRLDNPEYGEIAKKIGQRSKKGGKSAASINNVLYYKLNK